MMLLGALSALLIAALLAAAAYAWLLAGRALWRPRQASRRGLDAEAAFRRHPAARGRMTGPAGPAAAGPPGDRGTRPVGPDDDPEFLSALDWYIHGGGQGGA